MSHDPSPINQDFRRAAETILGQHRIKSDASDREPYEIDFWRQYRGRAGLVLQPQTTAEVAALVQAAQTHKVALVPQAGNTGLVKGGIPDATGTAAVLSLQGLNKIRAIDPTGDFLICEAGCVLQDIQTAADEAGRFFPLSLGSQGSCRIGGNISTNAGGVNVLRYGMMRQSVLGIEVVLPNGEIWDGLKSLKKDNTGYDLKQLFIGGEGTLGIVTAASLKLAPKPVETVTLWLPVLSPAIAVELYTLFTAKMGELISSFELLTGFGLQAAIDHLPGVRPPVDSNLPWHCLIELAWSFDEGLMAHAETILQSAFETELIDDGAIAQTTQQADNMWRIREGQSEATRHIGSILRTDISVPTQAIPALINTVQTAVDALPSAITLLPFGHIGDGNLHFNFLLPPDDDTPQLRGQLLDLLYDQIDALDGSISAEHGIGRLKQAAMLQRKSATELTMMRAIKTAFDPNNIMNPGVILPSPAAD